MSEHTTPNFFAPGCTYRWGPVRFRCHAVTTHPGTGDRVALGWYRGTGGTWCAVSEDEAEWAGGRWVDEADAVPASRCVLHGSSCDGDLEQAHIMQPAERPVLDPKSFDRPGQRAAARMLNADRQRPVTLATSCANCGHTLNWHDGACVAGRDEECGCTNFTTAGKDTSAGGESTRAATSTDMTVYRAQHDSIVMGLYTTRQAAYEHCEAHVMRDDPGAPFSWKVDEDGVAELWHFGIGEGVESPTGFIVTPLTVQDSYDEADDE